MAHENPKQWLYTEQSKTVIANLQKRNMNAQYFATCQEAVTAMLGMIPEGAVVSRGDSETLEQIGILEELAKRGKNAVSFPLEIDENGTFVHKSSERWQMAKEAVFADIYLTGINAVTMDGKLVNTDGWGNRVYPLIFGPRKVIAVAGINKLVKDYNAAYERIHTVASPLNARRHLTGHNRPEFEALPCTHTGKCVDCRSDMRICNYTVVIEGNMAGQKGRINVILIGEELGL